MNSWRPQVFRAQRPQGIDPATVDNAVATGNAIAAISPDIPPIFTLGHLAHYTQTSYRTLRAIVRRQISDPYRIFTIRKRPLAGTRQRFRVICVPERSLLIIQRWINSNILSKSKAHPSSTAFAPTCSIKKAAQRHCCARWLLKVDVTSFFESISEIQVYHVFHSLGYQPLVAFELARLCTRVGSLTPRRKRAQWRSTRADAGLPVYRNSRLGHLPQGAPSSPMLANLAMLKFDAQMTELANQSGLVYSRYADDITLSTDRKDFSRGEALLVLKQVYGLMGRSGLSPNTAKTKIIPPGARKIILGLLVDGSMPKLPREFKNNLRQHLYYLLDPRIGPRGHARARGFAAVEGLKNYVGGLIAFAYDVEPEFGRRTFERFNQVPWPS